MEAGVVGHGSGEGAWPEATVGILVHREGVTDLVIHVIQYPYNPDLPLKRHAGPGDRHRAVQALIASWARNGQVLTLDCCHFPDAAGALRFKPREGELDRAGWAASPSLCRKCYLHHRIEVVRSTAAENCHGTRGLHLQ